MTNEQYVAIIGDQSETQTCHGLFTDLDALFAWAEQAGYERERVSFYQITAPDDEAPGPCVTCGTQCVADGSLAVICPNCDWKERAIALLKALGDLGTQDVYTDAYEYGNRAGAVHSLCVMAGLMAGEASGERGGSRATMPEIEEAAKATDAEDGEAEGEARLT